MPVYLTPRFNKKIISIWIIHSKFNSGDSIKDFKSEKRQGLCSEVVVRQNQSQKGDQDYGDRKVAVFG